MARQCELVGLARSSYYYEPATESQENLELMRLLDEQYTRTPFYGVRRMTVWLREQGYEVNPKRVSRLMRLMGLHAIYPKPRLSQPGEGHRIYPYLLRNLAITRPDQVWATDITAKKRVAGEHLQRRAGVARIFCDDRYTFRGVSRSFVKRKIYPADEELVAIRYLQARKGSFGPRPIHDLCSRFGCELNMAADEIRMRMRFDYVLDRLAVRVSLVDVLLNIALWIYHRGLTLRTEIVGCVGETAKIELLEVHTASDIQMIMIGVKYN